MKHVLLGTTALVAAGLMVGEAYAADGVKLGIGGRYYGAYGSHFDTQDDDSAVEALGVDRGDAVKQDIEVHFAGEVVLDNGLTVGARTELEGQTQEGANDEIGGGIGDQIDAAFAYVSGGFGEFRLGDTADALAQLCYVAPSGTRIGAAGGMFGAESPTFVFHNTGFAGYGATNGTCYGISSNATKLVYFSPTFGGFHFALSYAPDGTEDTRNTAGGLGTRSDGDNNDLPGPFFGFQDSEIYSVAATFAQDFNGVNVAVGGGASWSMDLESDGIAIDPGDLNKREEYQAYAQVGFGLGAGGTVTVGATWAQRANVRDNVTSAVVGGSVAVTAVDDTNDDEIYAAGITYGVDAWTIGASASLGMYESACGGIGDDCEDEHEAYVIDAAYALGPGIGVGAMVGYDDYNDGDGDDTDDYDAISAGMGLYIGF
jgi:predicted porin